MKVIFTDFEGKRSKEYQTVAKKLTPEGIVRILIANVIPQLRQESANVIVNTGKWIDVNCWESPSGQYRVELIVEE